MAFAILFIGVRAQRLHIGDCMLGLLGMVAGVIVTVLGAWIGYQLVNATHSHRLHFGLRHHPGLYTSAFCTLGSGSAHGLVCWAVKKNKRSPFAGWQLFRLASSDFSGELVFSGRHIRFSLANALQLNWSIVIDREGEIGSSEHSAAVEWNTGHCDHSSIGPQNFLGLRNWFCFACECNGGPCNVIVDRADWLGAHGTPLAASHFISIYRLGVVCGGDCSVKNYLGFKRAAFIAPQTHRRPLFQA